MRYSPKQLQAARDEVAAWFTENAHAVRACGDYPAHVTEKTKDERLAASLALAREISLGLRDGNLTVAQRIRCALGEPCHPILP